MDFDIQTANKKQILKFVETHDCLDVLKYCGMLFKHEVSSESEQFNQKLIKLCCRAMRKCPPSKLDNDKIDVFYIQLCQVNQLFPDCALEVLTYLPRCLGLSGFIKAITMPHISHLVRENSWTIALSAKVFGIAPILNALREMVESTDNRTLGLYVIQKLPDTVPIAVLPNLKQLVSLLEYSLSDLPTANAANAALTSLADCVAPFGIEVFEIVIPALWQGVERTISMKTHQFYYLRSLSSLAALTDPDKVSEFADEIALKLLPLMNTDSRDMRWSLGCLRRVISHCSKPVVDKLLPPFFQMWVTGLPDQVINLISRVACELPLAQSVLVTKIVENGYILSVPEIPMQVFAKLALEELLLDPKIEQKLVDDLLTLTSLSSILPITKVAQSIPIDRYASLMVRKFVQRNTNASSDIRMFSCKILRNLVPLLPVPELVFIYRHFNEQLGESHPEVLAEVINLINQLATQLNILNSTDVLDPPLAELVPRIAPIMRNRNQRVQESSILLVRTLADLVGEMVLNREWMLVCYELLELQKSYWTTTKFAASSTFAVIAVAIGPADVVNTLLVHLKSADRQFRVTSAAAIASVAAETGGFAVLPILMNEYSKDDFAIQQSVLKSIAFTFEFSNLPITELVVYIKNLVGLVSHALVQTSQTHRQTAASIVTQMALKSRGLGLEPVFMHFINGLWPSIFEKAPHTIDRIREAILTASECTGVPAFTNYLWAGLFHPARKVRDIYWQMLNDVYTNCRPALVPTYPVHAADNAEQMDIRDVWI